MNGYELFQVAHFWHVAQGQGLVDEENSRLALIRHNTLELAKTRITQIRDSYLRTERVIKHHEIFKK
jgi:hypothetical protein